jgi:hypothetical protein
MAAAKMQEILSSSLKSLHVSGIQLQRVSFSKFELQKKEKEKKKKCKSTFENPVT